MPKTKNHFIHGRTRTPAWNSWQSMMRRCYDRFRDNYEFYGGRGITVCKAWHEFKNFYADMGDRPEGTTLDRINNDGNYEPGNCKWSTHKEQCNNRRK